MMKIFWVVIGIFASVIPSTPGVDSPVLYVSQINNDHAVVEFSYDDIDITKEILIEDINESIEAGSVIPCKGIEGMIYSEYEDCGNGTERKKYYQFRSDDDTVWWALSSDEVGNNLNMDNKYILYYSENFTSSCDCDPDLECECYLYDDIFVYFKSK